MRLLTSAFDVSAADVEADVRSLLDWESDTGTLSMQSSNATGGRPKKRSCTSGILSAHLNVRESIFSCLPIVDADHRSNNGVGRSAASF
jgi:hypothetical protein